MGAAKRTGRATLRPAPANEQERLATVPEPEAECYADIDMRETPPAPSGRSYHREFFYFLIGAGARPNVREASRPPDEAARRPQENAHRGRLCMASATTAELCPQR